MREIAPVSATATLNVADAEEMVLGENAMGICKVARPITTMFSVLRVSIFNTPFSVPAPGSRDTFTRMLSLNGFVNTTLEVMLVPT